MKGADPFDRSAPAGWKGAKMLTRNGRPLREVTQGAAHRWWALTAVEFGGGLVLANVMAEITAVFPKHERRKAMAVNTSVLALAQVTGLVLGGLLIDQFGWRSLFLVVLAVSARPVRGRGAARTAAAAGPQPVPGGVAHFNEEPPAKRQAWPGPPALRTRAPHQAFRPP